MPEYLLAQVADSLNWLVWAKTKDAEHNRNRPKPIPRPGLDEPDKTIYGSKPLPIEDMQAWLGWTN